MGFHVFKSGCIGNDYPPPKAKGEKPMKNSEPTLLPPGVNAGESDDSYFMGQPGINALQELEQAREKAPTPSGRTPQPKSGDSEATLLPVGVA
jgi:hypothetical protein